MTAKQVYYNTLIELSKVNAPALKLYEFNYYLNKAVDMFVNQIYNLYDTSQQTADDLRVLHGSVSLTPEKCGDIPGDYAVLLPMDYFHLLGCVCVFERTADDGGCHGSSAYIRKAATRLTSDAWAMVLDDYYNRPSYERPYYMLCQPAVSGNAIPNNPVTEIEDAQNGEPQTVGTDIGGTYGPDSYDSDTLASPEGPGTNFKRTFTFSNGHKESLVERSPAQRIGNPTGVRMEIRYGKSASKYDLKEVRVEYLRVPQHIMITQSQLDLTKDVSQILEWPDYVCQEITNLLVTLILERTGDPRLQTQYSISQSILRGQEGQAGSQASASA